MFPTALSLPGVCPVKTREVGVEWLLVPALILVLLIFAKLQCVRIFSVGGGEGREDCGGGLVVFVTPHSVVVVPPSHSHSLPPPRGFHLVKTHRFLV